MNVYMTTVGMAHNGYAVINVHTTEEAAIENAHGLMNSMFGFKNMSDEERKEIRLKMRTETRWTNSEGECVRVISLPLRDN